MRVSLGPGGAFVVAVLLMGASACGSSGDGAAAGSSPSASSPSATSSGSGTGGTASAPTPTGTTASLPAGLRTRPRVAAALADAAGRAGVAPEAVVIAGWTPVTWTDGALGCPQEGMAYTQALEEGELLLLRIGTQQLQYHAAGAGPFSYCANPSEDYTVGS
jgi:hypothetical protein